MSGQRASGRLSFARAASVIAWRDFKAILLSRTFIFFLLGPLFPVGVLALSAMLGTEMRDEMGDPRVGIAMSSTDVDAMLTARAELAERIGPAVPEMVVLARPGSGETFDAAAALDDQDDRLAGVVTGSLSRPTLTATAERLERWQGTIALIAAHANAAAPQSYPEVATSAVAASGASATRDRLGTAQAGQLLLFLLIMLLASMVLSNLVEEKGNKIIEIIAAAIPLDALFLGKLVAMLGISAVGIAVWGTSAAVILSLTESPLSGLADPGVGWPLFLLLGAAYFGLGYLLLGSVFLAIGSLAATVREVQTLSMPVTMLQVLVFFLASLAVTQTGQWLELAAIAFPFSSPFAMLARAAIDEALWPHALALAWQAVWVAILVRTGAAMFRSRVMKSGSRTVGNRRPGRLLRAMFRNGSGKSA